MDYVPEKTIFPKITILMNDFALSIDRHEFTEDGHIMDVTTNCKTDRKKIKLLLEINKKLNLEFSNSFKLSFSDIQLWERIFLIERTLDLR